MNKKISVALVAAAVVAGAAAPATAYGTPPVWLTGNSSNSDEWTVTSLANDMTVDELEQPQTFTGDAFDVEPLVAFDVVYSEAGNFAYAIGAFTENYYSIDLDDHTMQIVFEDLGDAGDDDIDTLAINGEVSYVTYTNPLNNTFAVGTIDMVTGEINYLADIDPYETPRSLAYFDGDLFVVDGGYGLAEDYVLRSLDLETGQLTDLYTVDPNITDVFDGDIDNNGIFRSLTVDNDDISASIDFNLLTNEEDLVGVATNAIDGNPMAFWGSANETVATRGGGSSGSGGLASTGFDASGIAIAGFVLAAAGATVVARRRSRA